MFKLAVFLLLLSACLMLSSGIAQIAAVIAGQGDVDTANLVGFSGIGLSVVILIVGSWRILRAP